MTDVDHVIHTGMVALLRAGLAPQEEEWLSIGVRRRICCGQEPVAHREIIMVLSASLSALVPGRNAGLQVSDLGTAATVAHGLDQLLGLV